MNAWSDIWHISDTYLTHFKISFNNLRPTGLLVRAFNILPRKKSSTDCKTYNGTESGCIILGNGKSWISSISSPSASLQPGHKLLGCLVLQVGTHIAGVSAVCMASPVWRSHNSCICNCGATDQKPPNPHGYIEHDLESFWFRLKSQTETREAIYRMNAVIFRL